MKNSDSQTKGSEIRLNEVKEQITHLEDKIEETVRSVKTLIKYGALKKYQIYK